jgi:hypothetical protein
MAPKTHIYRIILTAVSRLRAHELLGPRVSRKWLQAETWVEVLHMSRLINPMLEINTELSIKRWLVKFVPGAFLY